MAGRSAFGFGKRRFFKLAELNGQDFILPLHLPIFRTGITLTAVCWPAPKASRSAESHSPEV